MEISFNTPARRILIYIIGVVALMMIAAWYARAQYEANIRAAIFFRSALEDAGVRATVQWRGRPYLVDRGAIEPAEGRVPVLSVLTLAYKKSLAERSPLIALPGEDIESMRAAVRELADAQRSLAESAGTSADAGAVRALYPIQFLYALADAEAARRAFVLSGEDVDGARYDRALAAAFSAYRRDLVRFRAAFSREVRNQGISYAVADAIVSKEAIESALERLWSAADSTRQLDRARAACVRGDTRACLPSDILIPDVAVPEPAPLTSDHIRRAQEIRQMLSVAFDLPALTAAPMVALSDSSCARGFPGAPIFTMGRSRIAATEVPAPYMLGDARFLRTDAAASEFLTYAASAEITYLWYPSLTHYKCLRLQADTSAITATIAVRTLSELSPLSTFAQDASLASDLRALEDRLSGDLVTQESDAALYLATAQRIVNDLPDDLRGDVLTLMLQFKYHTGALADTIMKMALIEKANLTLSKRGVPTDLGAPRLFFSESGFIPLFLGDNGSLIRKTDDRLMPANTLLPSEEPYTYYSAMALDPAAKRDLIDDMAIFAELYEGATP